MKQWCMRLFLAGSSLIFLQCSSVLKGEPIDLPQITTPEVLEHSIPTVVLPEPSPVIKKDGVLFRAWIPREVLANGDVIEGHYLEVSQTVPTEETLTPTVHIPRAPKHVTPTAKPSSRVRTLAPPPDVPLPTVASPSLPMSLPVYPGVSIPLPGGGQ